MRKLAAYIIILLAPVLLKAQDISFVGSAPSQVETGTPFYIQYTLEAPEKGKNFIKPDLKNFSLINISTSQGTSSSISIVNGKVSKKFSYTITWNLMVQANKTGTFTIPPASVKVKGRTYKSNSLTITVSKGQINNQNQRNSNDNFDDNSDFVPSNKDLYLSLGANRTSVYVGEPIYVACKMFSRYDVSIEDFKPATYDNFWVKDLKMPSSVKAQRVLVNNRTYLTATLDKKVIFPQASGKLTIKPYKATFQLYDGWGFPAGNKDVVSNSKTINVKPLPANKPAIFSGAVGNFQISTTVDKTELYVDDALSITLKISGTGNFGLFDMPEISMPTTFEAMTPDNQDNLSVTESGISGSKTVKYSFIARVPGKYKIPQVEFSYFNPATGQYKTIKTDTISIKVIGDTSAVVGNNPAQKTQVTSLGNDIRFIKTNKVKLRAKNKFIYGTTGFWLAFIIPLAIFLFLIFFLRKKIKENADLQLVRYKKADKVSKKRLKTAASYMKAGEKEKFYEEISKALWGYVSDKLSIPLADLTRDTVVDTMKNKNVPDELIDRFIKIIDTCETARFAPSALSGTIEDVYKETAGLIGAFEKQI